MFRRSLLNRAITLSVCSAVSATALFSFNLQAQQNSADSTAAVERISVTSSRILREGAIAPSPVTSISGADLVDTGATNIGEALNELPALASTYSMANSGNSIGTAGLSLLDLRGMGSSRTLVLVDGKRHVSSSAGTASVDTNTIPTAWIESVEIITGGASAIYGADAVTGVVNFKLKKDIQGLELSATGGKANDNPLANQKYTFSYGQDIANGDGNIAFAADFAKQNDINATERSQTRNTFMSLTNPASKDSKDANGNTIHDGIADKITLGNAGYYDSSVNGNFLLNKVWYTFNPDGSVRPQNMGTLFPLDTACVDCEFLNLREYTDLQPAFDRYSFNLKGDYDLGADLNLAASAKHVVSQADSIRQPSFFEYGSALQIQRDNAYVTPGLAALMDAHGKSSIAIHRFNKDAGRRTEENSRITDQFSLNLTGQLNADWSFETFATHGRTRLEQVNGNNLIRRNFAQSIDAVKDQNGNIVCRDAAARAAGCVPTSIFGYGAVNQGAINWFNTTSTSNSTIEQQVAGGSVSNSALFDLPAGSVGVAGGVEYRHEQSDSVPDAFAATGATFLNALQETHGKFNVKEAFGEISIPLLTDLPLIQDLVFDAAVRVADYSTIGNATSWKSGLDWTVTDEIRVRSTYSVALRAPNISELYRPLNQTYFSRLQDPCDQRYKQNATWAANCAALGIPADFIAKATGASIEGRSGGSQNLKAEESNSHTVGFVYQPEWIEDFTFTVDYWSIEIDEAITNVSAQDILNKCVDSTTGLSAHYCGLIQRDPISHELKLITSISQNVAAQTAEGVDFEAGYDLDLLGGRLKTKLVGTYLGSRKTFSFQNNPSQFEQRAGFEGEAEWQENLSLSYSYDAWTASWKTRHINGVSLYTEQELAKNPDPRDLMSYGSYVLTDISLGYQFANGVNWSVGVDNLFDRGLPGISTGTSTEGASYDNVGQFFYTTVSYKM